MRQYYFLSRVFFLFFILNCIRFDTYAQEENKFLENKSGKWSYKYFTNDYEPAFKLTAAEKASVQSKLVIIADLMQKNPVTAQPKGVDLQVVGSVYESFVLGDGNHSQDRVPLKLNIAFCDWIRKD